MEIDEVAERTMIRPPLCEALKSALEEFAGSYKCPICMEHYTDPRMLPCTHSLCSACVAGCLNNKEECPVCKHKEGVTKRSLCANDNVRAILYAYQEVENVFALPSYHEPTLAQLKASVPVSREARIQANESDQRRAELRAVSDPTQFVKPKNSFVPASTAGGISNANAERRRGRTRSPALPDESNNSRASSASSSTSSTSSSSSRTVARNRATTMLDSRDTAREGGSRNSRSSRRAAASSSPVVATSVKEPEPEIVWGIGPSEPALSAGELVEVMGRHWPGINKYGGPAWVQAVHSDGTCNVKLIMDGTVYKNLEANLYLRRSCESLLSGNDLILGAPPTTRTTRRAVKDNGNNVSSVASYTSKRSRSNHRDAMSTQAIDSASTSTTKTAEATAAINQGNETKERTNSVNHREDSGALSDKQDDAKETDKDIDDKAIDASDSMSTTDQGKPLQLAQNITKGHADVATDANNPGLRLTETSENVRKVSFKSVQSSKASHTSTQAAAPISNDSGSDDEPIIETRNLNREDSPDRQKFRSRRKTAKVTKHPAQYNENQTTFASEKKKNVGIGGVDAANNSIASSAADNTAVPQCEGDIAVGSTVEVAARVGPGSNRPGGVAIVVDHCAATNTYTVKYSVQGGMESKLQRSLLAAVDDSNALSRKSRQKRRPEDWGEDAALQEAIRQSLHMQQVGEQEIVDDVTSALPGSGSKRSRAQVLSLTSNLPVSNSKRASKRATTPDASSERENQGELETSASSKGKSVLKTAASTKSATVVARAKNRAPTTSTPPCKSTSSSSSVSTSSALPSSSTCSVHNDVQSSLRQPSGRAQRKDRDLLVVTFSGTDGAEQRQLQDKLKKAAALGGGSVQIEFMDDFEPGVTTHVVVTNAKGLKAKDGRAIADRRTQKYMCAVLHGAWVVTTHWVSACVAAKHILTGPHPSAGEPVSKAAGASNSSKEDICHLEELYEVSADPKSSECDVPRRGRLASEKLFANIRFVLPSAWWHCKGAKRPMPAPAVRSLLACGGGTVCTSVGTLSETIRAALTQEVDNAANPALCFGHQNGAARSECRVIVLFESDLVVGQEWPTGAECQNQLVSAREALGARGIYAQQVELLNMKWVFDSVSNFHLADSKHYAPVTSSGNASKPNNRG